MPQYTINKGVGRQVEFMGLRAQYLILFAGGVLATILLVMVLFMARVPAAVCIVTGGVLGTAVVGVIFHLNARYGPHGMVKVSATHRYPRRIIHRKRIARLLKNDPLYRAKNIAIHEKHL